MDTCENFWRNIVFLFNFYVFFLYSFFLFVSFHQERFVNYYEVLEILETSAEKNGDA